MSGGSVALVVIPGAPLAAEIVTLGLVSDASVPPVLSKNIVIEASSPVNEKIVPSAKISGFALETILTVDPTIMADDLFNVPASVFPP